MRLAIVGGGAAGFFLAVNVKEMVPGLEVTILEKRNKVLAKVEVSGGGRCNCTNTFEDITDLRQAYPRGAALLKRLFKAFGPKEACEWFERHGVRLVVQEDQCVFPEAQDSHAIIDCFLGAARRHGVKIRLGVDVKEPERLLDEYDFVAVTVGGTPHKEGCVPSLFTFNIDDEALHALMGTVVEGAIASIPGTNMRAQGPLLVTHWGMSGPAILKLSSYAAMHLAQQEYRSPLLINWTGEGNAGNVRAAILSLLEANAGKLVDNVRPFNLPSRLWDYLLSKASLQGRRCAQVGKKGLNRLVDLLTCDTYNISSRCHYKDEFVTCGGVKLDTVDKNTLESRERPGLYYAGEVLDIDGITGGFNFQAAWTTAHAVARAIADICNKENLQYYGKERQDPYR